MWSLDNAMFGSIHVACVDPGIFVRGGPGQSDKKSSDVFFVFFILRLFNRSQVVNFKDIHHFSRFQRGSNIDQGGGGGGGGGPIAYSL